MLSSLVMALFVLAACGGAPRDRTETTDDAEVTMTVDEPRTELEKLAKEFAELTCESMQLLEKAMAGDAEAEELMQEVEQKTKILSAKIEEVVDPDDQADMAAWAEAFAKYYAETDCE